MAIERQPATPIEGTVEQESPEAISIAIENPESVSIETEDGGMIIDFDPNSKEAGDEDFDSNLADFMDDSDLSDLGNELISSYKNDKESRSDWKKPTQRG